MKDIAVSMCEVEWTWVRLKTEMKPENIRTKAPSGQGQLKLEIWFRPTRTKPVGAVIPRG